MTGTFDRTIVNNDDHEKTVKKMGSSMRDVRNDVSNSTEKDTSNPKVNDEIKDSSLDKGWAWMVALGCHLLFFISVSQYSVLAVLMLEILERFDTNATTISLMVSMSNLCFCIATHMSVNIFINKWTLRTIALTGTVVNVFCTLVFVLYQDFYVFFITFFIKTFSYASFQINCLAHVNFYFKKRRALASTLVVLGSNLANMIIPPVVTYLREEYGFRGCFVAVAAFELQGVVAACLLRPKSDIVDTQTHDSKSDSKPTEDCANLTNIFIVNDTDGVANEGFLHSKDDKEVEHPGRIENNSFESYKGIPHKTRTHGSFSERHTHWLKTWLWQKIKLIIDVSLINDPLCILTILGIALMHQGSKSDMYIISGAIEAGVSKADASILLTIASSAAIVSRVAFGFIAYFKFLKASVVVSMSGLVMAVLLGATPLFNTYTHILVYVVIYGMFQNIYDGLMPLMCLEVSSMNKLAKMMAFAWMLGTLSITLMTPLHGYLRDVTGTFAISQQYMGLFYLIGASLLISKNIKTLISRKCVTKGDSVDKTIQNSGAVTFISYKTNEKQS